MELSLIRRASAAVRRGGPLLGVATALLLAAACGGSTGSADVEGAASGQPPATTSSAESAAPAATSTPDPPPSTSVGGAPPMVLYGPAASNAQVLVLVNGAECETAEVVPTPSSATGYLWMSQIESGQCGASRGAALSFLLNDAATNETLVWIAGGVPPNVTVGVSLTERGAAP